MVSTPIYRGPAGIRCSPAVAVDLVLVQDDSGSMWLRDPAAAFRIRAAGLALSLLGSDVSGAGDRIGFASFGSPDQAQVMPLSPVAGAADRAAILGRIREMTFHKGSTDYDGGLRAAIDALQEGDEAYASPRWPRYQVPGRGVGVVLLSDGRPRTDGRRPRRRRWLEPHDDCVDLFRARGWPLFTIGVGMADGAPGARRVLARISERTGGLAFPTGDLHDSCAAIVSEIRDRRPVAGGVPGDEPGAGRG